MPEQSDIFLSRIVDLHARQLAIAEQMLAGQQEALVGQREALAGQKLSIERQQLALARQKSGLRIVFILIAVVLALAVLPYLYSWYRLLTR